MEQIELTDFERIGGLEGVRRLAETFYQIMDEQAEFSAIREMHPHDLQRVSERFSLFLSGWLGGPRLYQQQHGKLDLTGIHARFPITVEMRDLWLSCMERAIHNHDMDQHLKSKLVDRFKFPAERIRSYCEQQVPGLPRYEGLP